MSRYDQSSKDEVINWHHRRLTLGRTIGPFVWFLGMDFVTHALLSAIHGGSMAYRRISCTQNEQRVKSFLLAWGIPYIVNEVVETEWLLERIGWVLI